MQAALHVAREAYLRLASTVGPIPLTLLVSLIAVTAIAWAFTLYQPFAMGASVGSAMGGMEGMAMEDMAMDSMAAGWSFAGLLIFVTVWTIMMVAMMLPAAAPMILVFAAAQAPRDRHVAVPTWIFVAGYILVWAAAGLGAYVLDQVFTELLRSHASMERITWAPLALGITLILAGLYQFMPLKQFVSANADPLGFCSAVLARVVQVRSHGSAARPLLPRLLLGPVRCANGCRDDEYRLDAFAYAGGIRGKGVGVRILAAVGVALIAIGLLIASCALQPPSRA
jgi:predicted metal-binding membrane protein